jgi:hypothetical protein
MTTTTAETTVEIVKIERPRDTAGEIFNLWGQADQLGFFESIALAGLEDCWLRIPVATQRHFFGANVFGNKSVKVCRDGTIVVFWTVAFGRDWERVELYYNQVQKGFYSKHFPEQAWKR